jgi:hypothetical protein
MYSVTHFDDATHQQARIDKQTDNDYHTVLGSFVATKAAGDVCVWDVKIHKESNMKIGVARSVPYIRP